MSNNVHLITIVSSKSFGITAAALAKLRETITDLPETSFLDEDASGLFLLEGHDLYDVDSVQWYGEGSGSTFEAFETALASFEGEADLVIVWESGILTGTRLKEGKVTHHEVLMSLGDEDT